MKKLLLLGIILGISLGGFAQPKAKNVKQHPKKDVAVMKPVVKAIDEAENMLQLRSNKYVKSSLSINETQVGLTRYDLQSNGSNQNRIYMHSDRTIGATWTFGIAETGFTDRGTGYNYYDGTAWGPEPTTRIEDVKVGWPSYLPMGENGEMVVTHIGTTAGLKISKRATKGSGNWDYSTFAGPAGAEELLWPRVIASGANNQYTHLFGLTAPVANSGTLYNGQDGSMMYSRSSDGGATWEINNQQFPMTDTNYYLGFSGDSYSWAPPKGNTLAFVYTNDWEDAFLMKSTDNGNTWTKTVIFQHPYPKFKETTTYVLDTPTVADGFNSCVIDNNGKVHAFFGLMRVLNDDLLDGATSYFPYTDGLVHWTEDYGTLTYLNEDTLYDQGRLVGYLQDINGNDTIMEFVDIGTYFASLTSMPTATVDADNKIYLFFTSVMENLDNGSQNYRHIWYRRSDDQGVSWTDFVDATGGLPHNFDECVFPSLSFSSDEYLHLLYQKDDEPGLAVRGDEDPYGDNYMVYLKMSKVNIGLDDVVSNINYVSQNFPNPFTSSTSITVNLKNASMMGLEITNLIGQQVLEIPATAAAAGYHTLTIDRKNLPAGVYFYTVKAGSHSITKKMTIQ